jgi:hypothetical protein
VCGAYCPETKYAKPVPPVRIKTKMCEYDETGKFVGKEKLLASLVEID